MNTFTHHHGGEPSRSWNSMFPDQSDQNMADATPTDGPSPEHHSILYEEHDAISTPTTLEMLRVMSGQLDNCSSDSPVNPELPSLPAGALWLEAFLPTMRQAPAPSYHGRPWYEPAPAEPFKHDRNLELDLRNYKNLDSSSNFMADPTPVSAFDDQYAMATKEVYPDQTAAVGQSRYADTSEPLKMTGMGPTDRTATVSQVTGQYLDPFNVTCSAARVPSTIVLEPKSRHLSIGKVRPTSSAADLIGKRRKSFASNKTQPWGVQRILTYQFIEQQARGYGAQMPLITNADVELYCNNGKSVHHPLRSVCPPHHVDIRLMDGIEVSAEELLTFFPSHLRWCDMIYRLAQNGWRPVDMAKYVNYSRDLKDPEHMTRRVVSHWMIAADRLVLGRGKGDPSERKPWKTVCFTTKGWTPHKGRTVAGMMDYFLVDLAAGVSHFPQGAGARLLTRAIQLAVTRGHDEVRISDLKQYGRANLLIFPHMMPMRQQVVVAQHPDTAAVETFRTLLRAAGKFEREERDG